MVSRSMRDVAPVAPKHLFLRALACGLAPRFMEVRKFGDGTLRPLWKKTEAPGPTGPWVRPSLALLSLFGWRRYNRGPERLRRGFTAGRKNLQDPLVYLF